VYPQDRHRKTAWLSRFCLAAYPQTHPEGLLLDNDRTLGYPRLGLPQLRQLAALLGEARLPVVPLLQREVPYVPGVGTVTGHDPGLTWRWVEAESHGFIVPRGTDKKAALFACG
jgi:hypothetical protein